MARNINVNLGKNIQNIKIVSED